MPIMPPVNPVGGAGAAWPTTGTGPAAPATPAGRTEPTEDPTFGEAVLSALENLDAAHGATDQLAQQAATGDLQAVEDYMVMATETQLMTQLTVAVRNRAVEAFNDIMRMQV
jgi:flagellar hook-basal body complex protein FliE